MTTTTTTIIIKEILSIIARVLSHMIRRVHGPYDRSGRQLTAAVFTGLCVVHGLHHLAAVDRRSLRDVLRTRRAQRRICYVPQRHSRYFVNVSAATTFGYYLFKAMYRNDCVKVMISKNMIFKISL